jgi:hypothetical protein
MLKIIVFANPSEYSRDISGYTQLSIGIYVEPSWSALVFTVGTAGKYAGCVCIVAVPPLYAGSAPYGACCVGVAGATTGGGAVVGTGLACVCAGAAPYGGIAGAELCAGASGAGFTGD